MIAKNEIIHCEKWKEICDYHYERDQTYLPGGIVHCDIQSIKEFFNAIKGSNEKYIVISSRSDYGLCYQKHFPPWADFQKAVGLFIGESHEYNDLYLKARLNADRCNKDDLYSIKCYSHTDSTINEIPVNVVHWFLTNNCVNDDARITSIPFGINSTNGGQESINAILNINNEINVYDVKRDKYLYINFQFYTPERFHTYMHYQSYGYGEHYTCERDQDYHTFTQQLLKHYFCLCPNGNGVDCFRTLECLYLGCIPIVEWHLGTHYLIKAKLPIMMVDRLFNLTSCMLEEFLQSIMNESQNLSLEAIKFSYWKDQIVKRREMLVG